MDPKTIWVIVTIAAVIGGTLLWFILRRRRTDRLRQKFGPEYDRAVRESGDVTRAESALSARTKRVEQLHIRPLVPEDQIRYANQWSDIQARFVDDPQGSVTEADRLVGEVMHARGYP